MVGYFTDIRSQAGYIDTPLNMSIIEGWQRHTGVVLERWERDCIFLMDRVARRSYNDVVKYHAEYDRQRAAAKADRKKGK